MADSTLKMAADRLKMDVKDLLGALKSEGIVISKKDDLTPDQKRQLLDFLKKSLSGDNEVTVTRTRKQVLQGKSNVKVEVKQARKVVRLRTEVKKEVKKVVKEEEQEKQAEKPIEPTAIAQPQTNDQEQPLIEAQADQAVEPSSIEASTVQAIEPPSTEETTQAAEPPKPEPELEQPKSRIKREAGISFVERRKVVTKPIEAKIKAPEKKEEDTTDEGNKKRISAGKPQSKAKLKIETGAEKQAREASEEKTKKRRSSRGAKMGDKTHEKYRNFLNDTNIDDGLNDGDRAIRSDGKKTIKVSAPKHAFTKPQQKIVHKVEISDDIEVGELAFKMAMKASGVIAELQKLGLAVAIDERIDQDTAVLVVEELGHKPVLVQSREHDLAATMATPKVEGEGQARSPVITVMGHVDHGKTTLLDTIRKTKVADGETGGITQQMSAYKVSTKNGMITFVDTPGHAAFTAMRMRGSRFTDIVVLIVAADDGVMPQTREIVQHVKAAQVPLVVAINKMDKPDANPDKVIQELSQLDVLSEDWGGQVPFIRVSAMTGEGIEDLLENLLLQAEILELKAQPKGDGKGTVLECRLDKGKGIISNVLVQSGEFKVGDTILSNKSFGRIRAMLDDTGKPIKSAGPSTPVEIMGLTEMPQAGDEVIYVKNDKQAREMAQLRQNREREDLLRKQQQVHLENLFADAEDGEKKIINLIVKADTHGSLEAIQEAVGGLDREEVSVQVVGSGIGGIRESDATLAMAHNAIIIGFNVRADNLARKIIERDNIDIHYYSIIYEVVDQITQAIEGQLAPKIVEKIVGIAEVRDVFKASKMGQIAGCMVVEGLVKRNNPIRVLRNEVVIYEGMLESLRRIKEDVSEVRNGTECGIGVKNYNDVKAGDKIEVFERQEVKRTL